MMKKTSKFKEIATEPSVFITFIILMGFVLNVGKVDLQAVSAGDVGVGETGKNIRATTVLVSAFLCFFYLSKRSGLKFLIEKSNSLLISFALLCVASIVLSPAKTLTLYKSFEILTVVLILAIAYAEKDLYQLSKKYMTAIFWIYLVTAIGVYMQLLIFGAEEQRQLVGEQPFFGFMMTSKYPGMVGNALGFLGALVALFGLYKTSVKSYRNKRMALSGYAFFVIGFGVVILSYTRSILLFLLLSTFMFYFLRRKYVINVLMLVMLVSALAVPKVHNKIIDHMRRGDTEEKLSSMSGRTEMWSAVFSRDPLLVIVGGGYATGAQFMNYQETGELLVTTNVHNGFLEVVMSVGLLGGVVWLAIMLRILSQLLTYYRKVGNKLNSNERNFHIFVLCVFFLSYSRSLMNSTFVYLDYFYPVLVGLMLYGDSLSSRIKEINQEVSNDSKKEGAVEMPAKKEGKKYVGVTLR